ncbi:DUF2977 domain-containing protein [Staphylococcus xylosus]|uniref:DUF2977 domain-containing protein n=1 Tax=Staphylococcus xylosus TaxID=1288 RepID=UPI000E69A50B|nr:DUF2977 domain-containing protein [Staphylococcus xylosus]RIM87767.1 DUF2977 domain-containing protein [Staphylococcus xylosus]
MEMEILINEKSEITCFCITGSVEPFDNESLIKVDVEVPDNFIKEFDQGKFLYQNGHFIENPNYSSLID